MITIDLFKLVTWGLVILFILFCLILFLHIKECNKSFWSGYKNGQIDYYNGTKKWELRKQSDSSLKWEDTCPTNKIDYGKNR